MNEGPEIFGKEVEGLLRELAADPRSSLLRVKRPGSVRGFMERQAQVEVSATGQTTLERELLVVHREELAEVLLRACLSRLFAELRLSPFLNRSRTLQQVIEVDSLEQWSEKAARRIELAREAPSKLEGIDLVEACVRDHGELQRATVSQFAAAARRLRPSDAAEIYIGIDLVHGGHPQLSKRVLQQVIASRPTPYVLSVALENLGMVEARLEDYASALAAYCLACRAMDERPSTLVGWLFMAMQAGAEEQAFRAGALLDEMVRGPAAAVDSLIENYQLQRQQDLLEPTREGRTIALRLLDRLGPKSRRIAHVLL